MTASPEPVFPIHQGTIPAPLQVPLPAPSRENLPRGNISEAPLPCIPDIIVHPVTIEDPCSIVDAVNATNILPLGENSEPTLAPKTSTRSGSGTGRGKKGTSSNATPGGQYCAQNFAACTALGREWATIETNASIRNANLLQSIAQFVDHKEFKIRDFKALCESRNLACTKATIRAGYLPVIKAVCEDIGKTISDPQASKWNAAMKWAKSQSKHTDGIAEYMQNHGGVQGCLEERAAARGKKRKSNATQPFKVANFPPGYDGEVHVVLKVTGMNCEFVRIIEENNSSQSSDNENRPLLVGDEFPEEPEPGPVSGAGDAATNAVQVQIDETETDKEQV